MSNSPHIFDIDLEQFEEQVIQASHQHPVLIDLWADWCPPCVVIGPILEKVISEFAGTVKLARIEVDEGDNMKIAGRYQVRGFPTIILFQHGEEKGRFSGAKPQHAVEDFIHQHADL